MFFFKDYVLFKFKIIKFINSFFFFQIKPILFLRKDSLNDIQEIVGLLIYYKSPFNFRIRQYNSNFQPFIDQIKSSLNSRFILTQSELVINMYVIYQKKQSDSIYRAQIINMDSEVES